MQRSGAGTSQRRPPAVRGLPSSLDLNIEGYQEQE
jgi:hypothetical protein